MSLLEISNLSKRFGGVVAVDGCSLSVADRSITGLIGPNGSGKTTVFNLVTGFIPRDRGEAGHQVEDRKSTRLNSSHSQISYAVFCLKKKKTKKISCTSN